MRVEYGGDVYSVGWHHCREGKKKGTVCTVELKTGETWTIVAVGGAKLHTYDRFEKETGRRLSLTRAIERFSRAERTAFWEAYWGRK